MQIDKSDAHFNWFRGEAVEPVGEITSMADVSARAQPAQTRRPDDTQSTAEDAVDGLYSNEMTSAAYSGPVEPFCGTS